MSTRNNSVNKRCAAGPSLWSCFLETMSDKRNTSARSINSTNQVEQQSQDTSSYVVKYCRTTIKNDIEQHGILHWQASRENQGITLEDRNIDQGFVSQTLRSEVKYAASIQQLVCKSLSETIENMAEECRKRCIQEFTQRFDCGGSHQTNRTAEDIYCTLNPFDKNPYVDSQHFQYLITAVIEGEIGKVMKIMSSAEHDYHSKMGKIPGDKSSITAVTTYRERVIEEITSRCKDKAMANLCRRACNAESKIYLPKNKNEDINLILGMVENFYNEEIVKFISSCFRKQKDILKVHTQLVKDCNELLNKNKEIKAMNLTEAIEDLLHRQLEKFIYEHESMTIATVKKIQNKIADLNARFVDQLKIKVHNHCMTEIHFKYVCAQSIQKSVKKLQTYIQQNLNSQSALFEKHLKRLLEKSVDSLIDFHMEQREITFKSSCALPILQIKFDLSSCRTTDDIIVFNSVRFSKSGYPIVGERYEQPDSTSLYDVIFGNEVTSLSLTLLTALIFQSIRQKSEAVQKVKYHSTVVTVTFWFYSSYSKSIKEACALAGFQQTYIVNDSKAAVLGIAMEIPSHFERQYRILILNKYPKCLSAALYLVEDKKSISMINSSTRISNSENGNSEAQVKKEITDILFGFNNIKFAFIVSNDEAWKKQALKEVTSKNIKCPLADVVHSGIKYYTTLLEKQVQLAIQSVKEVSVYDVIFITENGKIYQAMKSCTSHQNQKFSIPELVCNVFEAIHDTPVGPKIESIVVQSSIKNLQGVMYTTGENILEVFLTDAHLKLTELGDRENTLKKEREHFNRSFKLADDLEISKFDLENVAKYLLANIQQYHTPFHEQIKEDVKRAFNILEQNDISKEKILDTLKYLKRIPKIESSVMEQSDFNPHDDSTVL